MNDLVSPWLYYDALQCFTNDLFGSVRSITINGEPWFVGSDVARCLGYKYPSNAIQDHVFQKNKLDDGWANCPPIIDNLGRKQYPIWINEAGVYQLIFTSKLPAAEAFQDWATSEVLPTMRKVGYSNSMRILQEELENKNREIDKIQRENNKLNIILQGCDTWSLSTFKKK